MLKFSPICPQCSRNWLEDRGGNAVYVKADSEFTIDTPSIKCSKCGFEFSMETYQAFLNRTK